MLHKDAQLPNLITRVDPKSFSLSYITLKKHQDYLKVYLNKHDSEMKESRGIFGERETKTNWKITFAFNLK